MNKELIKDIAVRAVKTFLQAFLATFSLGIMATTDSVGLKALAVASVSAGLSAVWNTLLLTKKS
jgi:hypothetical protein